MVYRLQHIFLGMFKILVFVSVCNFACLGAWANEESGAVEKLTIDKEFFAVGIYTGMLSIQDFNSELSFGFEGSFKASEDFFLQFNYFQADASLSSFELSQGQLFSGADRKFTHYDFLLGYNLFQAEFFGSGTSSAISALYLVAGAGETEFGGENNFTLTVGTGYQFALNRRYVLRVDYRDHIFKSSLLEEDANTHNTQISVGLSYLF